MRRLAIFLLSLTACAPVPPGGADGGGAGEGAAPLETGGAGQAGPPDRAPDPAPDPVAPALPEARLPSSPGAFSPSMAAVAEGATLDPERLADVQICADCHPDVAAHWRTSAHARASFDNPWYRALAEDFRAAAGFEASRLCAGCHDPVLLFAGAMDAPLQPDDPRTRAGIPCLLCHGVVEASPDGDGSYVHGGTEVPLPDPADAAQVAAHGRAMSSAPLRSGALCGSCHRSFLGAAAGLPVHLGGIDDLGDHLSSAFAGSHASLLEAAGPSAGGGPGSEAQSCRSCHMPRAPASLGDMGAKEGTIASHRWAGAHTPLAEATGEAQIAAVRDQLDSALSIDLPVLRLDGAWLWASEPVALRPGGRLEADVVLRNLAASHRFPGGTRDMQDTWLEVRVWDRQGQLVAEAGAAHERGEPSGGPVGGAPASGAARLHSILLDAQGRPETLHRVERFRALGFDRTIPARDARAFRFALTLPDPLPASERGGLALRIEARLRHRRHSLPVQRMACEASRSPRGRAFQAASRAGGRAPIDPCRPQPITELARAQIWLGAAPPDAALGLEAAPARPLWERLRDHGLALSQGRQEDLPRAERSLERALEVLPAEGSESARASILALLGRVAGREGRIEDALERLEEAEALGGPHPAIARLRGEALARVWRWALAAEAFEQVSEAAPSDWRAWRDLARALGSAGRDRRSFEAALRGLALQPRNADLLRSQALALRALDHPQAEAAADAADAHRRPDLSDALLARCAREVPDCGRDRDPIPTIALEARGFWRATREPQP